MKKTVEKKRKTITIDITDWYDSLKNISQREFRTIEEQCRFFIKKGMDGNDSAINIVYTEKTPSFGWPVTTNPLWNTGPYCDTNVERMFADGTATYCKGTNADIVDCNLDKSSGCYEAKN